MPFKSEFLRFYAGAPLVVPGGHRIGTLSVMDTRPRSPSEELIGHLERFASMVVAELELRRRHHLEDQLTKKALRKAEKLYETLFEEAGSALLVCGPEGEVRRANEKACRLFGDRLVGRSIFDLQAASKPVVQRRLLQALKEGKDLSTVLECQRGEEKKFWAEIEATAVEIQEEVLLRVVVRDVSERHCQREKLHRKQEALKTIFEHVPVPIAFVGEDGSFEMVSRAFEEVLGWSREEATGHERFMEVLFPDTDARRRALHFIERSDETWKEFRVQSRSGEKIPLLALVRRLEDGRRIGVALDLRERRRHERRLEQARRLAGLGYWEQDLQSGEMTFSAETRDLFGWPEEKPVRYRTFLQAVCEKERDRVQAAHQATTAGEGPHSIDYRICRSSGETRVVREWGELRKTPRGEPGILAGALLDVTEQARQRQEVTEAKQRAEEAARIKSALLQNMNHELRTPLTGIVNCASLLRADPSLTEKFAERIYRGGKRLERTLNTVMDFAELEGGEVNPSPESFDARDAVSAAARKLREDADQKGLSLDVDVPDQPVEISLDRHLTERICVHLLSNAIKFTEVGSVTIRIQDAGEKIAIVVEDTGIGMDPDFIPDAFEEFVQASVGNSRNFEGNGLGLTIARGFARLMGGSVQLKSTPGEGTEASVVLPRDSLGQRQSA